MINKILKILEVTANMVLETLELFGKTLSLILPGSGLALTIIENRIVKCEPISSVKYWAVGIYFEDAHLVNVPLLKQSIMGILKATIAEVSFNYPNSENWQYYDYDTGLIKFGYEFPQTKYYRIPEDLTKDLAIIAIISLLVAQLSKLNMHKFASALSSMVSNTWNRNRLRNSLKQVVDTHGIDIANKIENMGDVLTQEDADLILSRISELKTLVGLKLVVH